LAYAHTPNENGKWHDLVDHLRAVAALAAGFAEPLGARDLAYWLGLWHDIGKFNPAFQSYLRDCAKEPAHAGRGPDHKAAGTEIAARHAGPAALLIRGHHGGLDSPTSLKSWMDERSADEAVQAAIRLAHRGIEDVEPEGQISIPDHVSADARSAEFFLRLVFAALIDADRLDTERHFRPRDFQVRGSATTMADLWGRLERDQTDLQANGTGSVNAARRAIYEHCVEAAASSPGVFRLAVPTGGGKTRSAMAFALQHAIHHGHQRVIVAVPLITITEQTADVYRGIFMDPGGDHPVVLEHHSQAEPVADDEDFHPAALWSRLAAENWDAPIVVTTTVQLFESLFTNLTSRSRKLHRLAKSVIILDEAQALPPHVLRPVLDGVRELTTHYGATVVLSTATQPAFHVIPEFADVAATEIVPNAETFFRSLSRVRYDWRTGQPLDWNQVAALLEDHRQALAVVNTKNDAMKLLDALEDPEALHLSTLLCGAHRRRVIAEVKRRLDTGLPCRLISTQVIEAGVDLDFPVVARSLGPLDSVMQAAGRCNREGELPAGTVIVFDPAEGTLPPGAYRAATGVTRSLIARGSFDPEDPATTTEYFSELFRTLGNDYTDRERIQAHREGFHYGEVARRFRMIGDDTESLIITNYGSEAERQSIRAWIDRLATRGQEARFLLRRLQPYVVNVRRRVAEQYRGMGIVSQVLPGIGEWLGGYDSTRGITVEKFDAEDLVV
jgi:CRISPR-associated endonuclease/helicase Cas3